jgi:hypothetical protein
MAILKMRVLRLIVTCSKDVRNRVAVVYQAFSWFKHLSSLPCSFCPRTSTLMATALFSRCEVHLTIIEKKASIQSVEWNIFH